MVYACPADAVGCSDVNGWVFGPPEYVIAGAVALALLVVVSVVIRRMRRR